MATDFAPNGPGDFLRTELQTYIDAGDTKPLEQFLSDVKKSRR